jgi:peroxiredoxin
MLEINQPAPDFELNVTPSDKFSIKDLRGKKVILVFYPADWSPVCGDQLALYNETNRMFSRYNAELVGISVDGKWCHAAYRDARNLRFRLMADFEPKGAVARTYGVYNEKEGRSERALFIIDEEGIIRWNYLSPSNVNPGADGILEALQRLSEKK